MFGWARSGQSRQEKLWAAGPQGGVGGARGGWGRGDQAAAAQLRGLCSPAGIPLCSAELLLL